MKYYEEKDLAVITHFALLRNVSFYISLEIVRKFNVIRDVVKRKGKKK